MSSVPRATGKPGDPSPFALGLLLRRAHNRAATAMAEAIRPFGIELRHFAVLIELANNGPANQRDLAAAVGSDKASMVRVIDDLENAGYATRRTDPADRRARTVELTGAGLEVFDAAHLAAGPLADRTTAHLDPGERAQLLDLLTRFTYPPGETDP
ncbi:MarR family winged helix-turn-helix transcriptional regulator [Actinophytocola oryzae]|uniref:DNA-binding MarR family transcriptional regulator n=1 Tax=Actinophytocola oryzae TaxID=502181 RepID=A0A4R7VKB8_9PSEU|nr:MarR family winged helix-turn-helix transcriptional regulator [Actinophytocola oryzae]TDV49914.1 DNA-binding MarR family transcriptional regulator [Actinophytocola oryzae]